MHDQYLNCRQLRKRFKQGLHRILFSTFWNHKSTNNEKLSSVNDYHKVLEQREIRLSHYNIRFKSDNRDSP